MKISGPPAPTHVVLMSPSQLAGEFRFFQYMCEKRMSLTSVLLRMLVMPTSCWST